MYAVFRTGGKQYRASKGDRIRVEKLDADEGADVRFDEVLLVGEGADITVGTPTVEGTAVTARVLSQGKTRKVPVVKFRRRQNYLRQGSHRQFFTEVEIVSIGAGGAGQAAAADEAKEPAAGKKVAKKAASKKASGKKKASKKVAKKAAKKVAKKDGD
jgi:large subunit ribosomal protein L21